ncbi:MAG TPA: hypothetical protein VNW51_05835, partial [Mucilaginibacter sp.]|nr:hypothetical protein [Mucilaginibacter sp.]
MKIRSFLGLAVLAIALNTANAQSPLKAGIWRGVTKTASGAEIPFNFEVTNTGAQTQWAIINGSERFKVTDVKYKGDSVFVHMPLFDSEFRVKRSGENLTGRWIKNLGTNLAIMAFNATPNTAWRFKTPQKPAANITGRW